MSLTEKIKENARKALTAGLIAASTGCATMPRTFTGNSEDAAQAMREKHSTKYGCVGVGVSMPVWSTSKLSESAARTFAINDYLINCDSRSSKELGYDRTNAVKVIGVQRSEDGKTYVVAVTNPRVQSK